MIYVIAGKKYGNYLYFHQVRDKRQTNYGQARLIFFSETGSPTGRRGKRAKSNCNQKWKQQFVAADTEAIITVA